MTQQQATAIAGRFAGTRVLVVGDLMLDIHLWGKVGRVSPEAPVLIVDAQEETLAPGGAANAAAQIAALGGEVVVAGVIGQDADGERLRNELQRQGMHTEGILSTAHRPTTSKTRILAGNAKHAQHLLRVDRETRTPLAEKEVTQLIDRVREILPSCQALLFSDYDKGVLGKNTVELLGGMARAQGIPVTANPKPRSITYYRGVDVAQLNRSEAQEASKKHLPFGEMDEVAFHKAGVALRGALGVQNLLITRSEKGLTVFLEDETWHDVPAHPINVEDVAGAGDSTIAGLTLALAAGVSVTEAVVFGNATGAAVVQKVGVDTATQDEIIRLFV
jgi:D-beta-D-heptose 7-phosphate kinase/D-beta-D-heptose 1-phosphate adenosyltransferase